MYPYVPDLKMSFVRLSLDPSHLCKPSLKCHLLLLTPDRPLDLTRENITHYLLIVTKYGGEAK